MRVDRLQNPQRFHHRRRAVGVVGGADAGVPRVEVAAEHDDFVFQRGVGARQLRDHVDRVAVGGAVERGLHVDAQLHRDLPLDHPLDHVVVLAAHRDRRHRARSAVAAGDEDGAVLADARLEDRARARVLQNRGDALRARLR